jgi:hypothetical protein
MEGRADRPGARERERKGSVPSSRVASAAVTRPASGERSGPGKGEKGGGNGRSGRAPQSGRGGGGGGGGGRPPTSQSPSLPDKMLAPAPPLHFPRPLPLILDNPLLYMCSCTLRAVRRPRAATEEAGKKGRESGDVEPRSRHVGGRGGGGDAGHEDPAAGGRGGWLGQDARAPNTRTQRRGVIYRAEKHRGGKQSLPGRPPRGLGSLVWALAPPSLPLSSRHLALSSGCEQ